MNDLDRELAETLAALRDEALPESALAAVRSGVRAQIEAGRRRRVWTAWVSLAAAAAVAWAALVIPWTAATLDLAAPRSPEVDSMALARPTRQFEEARLKPGSGLKAAPRRAAMEKVRKDRNHPIAEPPREEQTQFIRIITDDPNVVILWALNSKGETR